MSSSIIFLPSPYHLPRAMRNNKLIIFLSALAALYLMTVLSALLGWVVTTFIPRAATYYTCTGETNILHLVYITST